MALINCPECGGQVSDTANKCPHCGYSLKNTTWHNATQSTLGTKITKNLIISISLILVSLVMMGLSMCWMTEFSTHIEIFSEWFLAGIICFVCAFIPLFFSCKILGKSTSYNWKIFGLTSVLSVLSLIVLFMACSVNTRTPAQEKEYYERMAEQRKAEQLQKEQEEAEHIQQEQQKWLGTYVYNQPKNLADDKTLTIKVNEDGSLKAIAVGRSERTFYGTWNRVKDDDGNTEMITLHFPAEDVVDRGHYLLGVWIDNTDNFCYFMEDWVIKDGYLYKNKESIISKNPKNRVKITKVD